jgi:hypothetical protein
MITPSIQIGTRARGSEAAALANHSMAMLTRRGVSHRSTRCDLLVVAMAMV